ncbi:L-aspartate oxidase [Lysinibacillus sp. BW-2-10]|uniref:L-aspartate oxidase n=1 Tax=Lysinibacillus sp. BW-2-10 TaxID=2590030 RepID=UPI00117FFEAF|nr:L-aspartate oxidase [Lysinibacillus sp. BW-2-10]TSI03141.1 L-aspartate oxidase [Lysinibacillus sp. BW-2-10]
MKIETDVVIIGSGVAALQAARILAPSFTVHIVTKADITHGSSYKAQGGIAAVTSEHDNTSLHIQDTLDAGEHHHAVDNVNSLVEQGKEAIAHLIQDHFQVDRNENGEISLGLEGAHRYPRIIHSGGDATGKALIDYLIEQLPKKVVIHQHELAYELLLNSLGECIGVKTMTDTDINTYFASYVILATGGAGALYASTSNCPDSYGDGIALAFLAGAKLADMEFVQFHPSLLYINGKARGLVSEAVRGAGGYFTDANGRKLMEGIHPLGDLAPRHITAYEMYKERAKGNEVYLDISNISEFNKKFPTITTLCEKHGINLSEGRIPIAPGSHFLMGGIVADAYGRTSIPRLLAVGEVACTGVHGANRLASNSLLEGITFGKLMAENLLKNGTKQKNDQIVYNHKKQKNYGLLSPSTLQKEMLAHAGILRDDEGLNTLIKALPTFEQLQSINFSQLTRAEIELYFMHITALLIANAALTRQESRGAHIRKDYPEKSNEWQNKWVVFENGKMNVREGLYEQNQITNYVTAVF